MPYFYRVFCTLLLFLHKLVNNGKNVDSANLCMVFSISLVFCLATIGVGVFRCGDSGCRTFLFLEEKKMHKEKCNYCGKEIDADCMSALENGSPACPDCVAEEEKKNQYKTQKEN